MNKQQFMEAIEQHPELTASGFGVMNGGDVAAERAALSNFYDAFCMSFDFLQSKSREELNTLFSRDSYALKHIVERVFGTYVPEGAFDLAALMFGCTLESAIEKSPSVYFRLP